MRALLADIASIAVVVFAATSMISVGLAYSVRRIVGPLGEPRAVFRALVANFVLVPLLAVGIERLIPLGAPLALGLFLLAGSAGAPFLIKLAGAARNDVALSAALLVLLAPLTVVFLPFYVPLAMAHPSLQGLSYEPSSVLALGLPLLSTLIAPLVAGGLVHAIAPRFAMRLAPVAGKLASVALVVLVAAIAAAHFPAIIKIVRSGAVVASVLLTLGSFAIGFLLSRRERAVVLGLGTAQRNVAGAMVIAARDFADPDVLVMVIVSVLAGLVVLFALAWLMSRRAPHVGVARPDAAPA
jgi:predicted Na+-dependent transporter